MLNSLLVVFDLRFKKFKSLVHIHEKTLLEIESLYNKNNNHIYSTEHSSIIKLFVRKLAKLYLAAKNIILCKDELKSQLRYYELIGQQHYIKKNLSNFHKFRPNIRFSK